VVRPAPEKGVCLALRKKKREGGTLSCTPQRGGTGDLKKGPSAGPKNLFRGETEEDRPNARRGKGSNGKKKKGFITCPLKRKKHPVPLKKTPQLCNRRMQKRNVFPSGGIRPALREKILTYLSKSDAVYVLARTECLEGRLAITLYKEEGMGKSCFAREAGSKKGPEENSKRVGGGSSPPFGEGENSQLAKGRGRLGKTVPKKGVSYPMAKKNNIFYRSGLLMKKRERTSAKNLGGG